MQDPKGLQPKTFILYYTLSNMWVDSFFQLLAKVCILHLLSTLSKYNGANSGQVSSHSTQKITTWNNNECTLIGLSRSGNQI